MSFGLTYMYVPYFEPRNSSNCSTILCIVLDIVRAQVRAAERLRARGVHRAGGGVRGRPEGAARRLCGVDGQAGRGRAGGSSPLITVYLRGVSSTLHPCSRGAE